MKQPCDTFGEGHIIFTSAKDEEAERWSIREPAVRLLNLLVIEAL